MKMATELCHEEDRRVGSDNPIASLSDDRWVAGPYEAMCSTKMARERHGILSLGHRAVAIVATSHGTDVPLARQVPLPGACRRRAPVDLTPILRAQTTIGESGDGLNQQLPLSDKKNRIRYRRGWDPRDATHGVSHERLVRG